jgi:hypothetical protein
MMSIMFFKKDIRMPTLTYDSSEETVNEEIGDICSVPSVMNENISSYANSKIERKNSNNAGTSFSHPFLFANPIVETVKDGVWKGIKSEMGIGKHHSNNTRNEVDVKDKVDCDNLTEIGSDDDVPNVEDFFDS